MSWRVAAAAPWPLWPALALLVLYAAMYLQFAGQLVQFPFDLDQGEGYDAWSAWLINRGQLPYTAAEAFPYYSHGYPPLWSYLVSIPMAWLGPGLGSARAVSTLAGLLAAVVVGLAARRRAHSGLAGLLAGGFFLASPYVFHTTPLARVNGTMLLFALLAVWAFEFPTRRRVALGTLALLAALFTKPTAVDAVVACIGFALLAAPRRGAAAAAALAGLGLAGLALLEVASGGVYLRNVLAGNAGAFDLAQLRDYLGNFALLHGVLLLLALLEVGLAVQRREWSPWVLYFPASLALVVTAGKWGAGESYFLAPIAVACVLAGSAVARLLRARRGAAPGLVLGGVLLVQALVLSHGPLGAAAPWLPDRGFQSDFLGRAPTASDLRAGHEIVALMRRARGPVLSEDAAFAIAAGKEVVGATPPSVRALHQAGVWDPEPLVSDIRARRYDTVVLKAELYPEPVLAAVGRHYYLDRTVQVNGATYQIFLPGAE